jgi:YVTN family beta-propeller protein
MVVPGRAGVPAGRTAAVVLNVTATQTTSNGWLTVYPSTNQPRPLASNLNFVAGETVANLVIVPLGYLDGVMIYNRSGHTHVVVDVVGWFDLPGDRLELDGLSMLGSEIAIDPTSTYAYISRPAANQVEVLRLADGAFEDPIPVGSSPTGLDLSPDGSLLYVANTGSQFVSVVDVEARAELYRFPVPSVSADRPFSIAVLANGTALVTTTFNGTGYGGRLYKIDLATRAATLRTDFSYEGRHSEATVLRASGNRKSAVVAEGNSSAGLIARYDTTSDAFVQLETDDYVDSIATNYDGTVTLANGGGRFYDEDMKLRGAVAECGSYGSAVNRAGTMGYGLRYDYDYKVAKVALCDPVTLKATHISVGAAYDVGRLALSPDGTTLVGITDSGVLLFKP